MQEVDAQFFALKEYVFKTIIGQGGFGIVFLVFSKHYQRDFAVKRIPQTKFEHNEVKTMSKIDNPHVVALYSFEEFHDYIYMTMEYCPNSLQLQLHLTTKDRLLRNKYAKQVLLAVKACHDRNIYHGDIKPSNFLIDQYDRIKICDFGLSFDISTRLNHEMQKSGTFLFLPPEIITRKECDFKKVDIWALGITFFLMATRKFPFHTNTKEAYFSDMIKGFVDTTEICDPLYSKLILSCLELDPSKRPTVDELLKNPIFEEQPFTQSVATQSHFSSITQTSKKLSKQIPGAARASYSKLKPLIYLPRCSLRKQPFPSAAYL